MEKSKTCCFAGNGSLSKEKIEQLLIRLNQEIDYLINQGITNFISGGSLGFDQIAASMIIAKKEMGKNIRLIFALPYKNQDEFWGTAQKMLYLGLLWEADEIIYVSEEYAYGCMKKRNRYMVDSSEYCICAKHFPIGRTAQTVRYARQSGIKVVNVARAT